MKEIQHKHLLLRAETKDAPQHHDFEELDLNRSIAKLIEDIGMKVVLSPRCVWVGQEGNEGYTGQAGLETSHIAYHIWNKPDAEIMQCPDSSLFQLDVYTCGCLDEQEIIKVVQWIDDNWQIKDLELQVFDRAITFELLRDITISNYDTKSNNIQKHINRI